MRSIREPVAMETSSWSGPGSVSHEQAASKAEGEYAKYRARIAIEETDVERAYLETVKDIQHEIGATHERI